MISQWTDLFFALLSWDYAPAKILTLIVVLWFLAVYTRRRFRHRKAFRRAAASVDVVVNLPGTLDQAKRAADERKKKIRMFLEQQRNQVFRETPDSVERTVDERQINEIESCAQQARLKSELGSVHTLLLGRLVDAIVEACGPENESVPTIAAEPSNRVNSSIPIWTLVVYAPDSWVRSRLQRIGLTRDPLGDWLPIKIVSRPQAHTINFGIHDLPKSMGGRFGGWIIGPNWRMRMTCSHSLPSKFPHTLFSVPGPQNIPDVALCDDVDLQEVDLGEKWEIAPASFLSELGRTKQEVAVIHPSVNSRPGRIIAIVHTIFLDSYTIRFPHTQVIPIRTKWDLLFLWRRPWFAKPGDSGAWTFHKDSNQWIGMVTCGDSVDNGYVYIAQSEALIDYIRTLYGSVDSNVYGFR